MEQEHLLILDLIETGKITVPQALNLIEAVDDFDQESAEPNVPCGEIITIQLYLN